MIRTRQAPFPSHTYRAVLQLPRALGEKKLPLAFSFSRRAVLSLPLSSACSTTAPCWGRGSPAAWGGETTCSKKCFLLPLDPMSAGARARARARGSWSADTKWGQAVGCSAEMIAPLVVEGNCFRLDLKARKEWVPRWVSFALKGPTSAGRGSDPVTFLSLR